MGVGYSASTAAADSSTLGWESSRRTTSEAPGSAFGEVETPVELCTVHVELVWARYERESAVRFAATQDPDDLTLSVCMIISWPPRSLVDRAAEFQTSGETLHVLIELFGLLQAKRSVVGAKSRIEDGQFVAWLSYSDVVTVGDAFLFVRETFQKRGLIPRLKTRDVRLPADDDDGQHEPPRAQAS